MRKDARLRLGGILLVLLCLSPCFLAADRASVLVLHSYHQGLPWTDEITRGVFETFENGRSVDLAIEYMDAKRHAPKLIAEGFESLLTAKYRANPPDIVILSDNSVFDFFLEHGEALFPGVPAVFCGVNNYTPLMLAGRSGITGIVEATDIRRTIELALRLHPRTQIVVAVSDTVPSGRLHLLEFREIAAGFPEGVTFSELSGLDPEELEGALAQLPQETVVLHLSYFRDRSGRSYSHEDSVRVVVEATTHPVYTVWRWKLGLGPVGGVMTSGYTHGCTAAEMALRVLRGESPSEIPVVTDGHNVLMFDYQAMTAHGIRERDLPPETIIIGKPQSLYQEHKTLFWSVGTVGTVLLLLLGVLAGSILRRRKVERALHSERSLLRGLIDTLPGYVFWKDHRLVYQGCNRGFAELLGVEPEYLAGWTDDELPQTVEGVSLRVEQEREVIRSGKPQLNREERMPDPNGKEVTLLVSRVPLLSEGGRVEGLLTLATDISERRRIQEQLQRSQKMKSIGQLAGGVAHDFNNLLTGILGNAQLLELYPELSDNQRNLVANIVSACRRAAELTRQLLGFARKGNFRSESIDAHALVREVVDLLRHSVDPRVEIDIELAATSFTVTGDVSQLQSALLNLGMNARDAMPDGGLLRFTTQNLWLDEEYLALSAPECPPGRYLEIAVRDTGIGMDADTVERIFEPFFTTKGPSGGTGLGLASVYGTVQSHRGLILVYSHPGLGTEMRILLPVNEEDRVIPPERPTSLQKAHVGSGTVLVVDDEKIVRDYVQRALQAMGYAVVACVDGVDAEMYYETHWGEVDLVILDLTMPRRSGAETFRRLKGLNPQARILISSGFSSDGTVSCLLEEGAAGFLQKPFRVNELAEIVTREIGED